MIAYSDIDQANISLYIVLLIDDSILRNITTKINYT